VLRNLQNRRVVYRRRLRNQGSEISDRIAYTLVARNGCLQLKRHLRSSTGGILFEQCTPIRGTTRQVATGDVGHVALLPAIGAKPESVAHRRLRLKRGQCCWVWSGVQHV